MTPGTSPHWLRTPFTRWTDAAMGMLRALRRVHTSWWRELRLSGPPMARAAAILYLAALGIVLATAWRAPAGPAGNAIAGFPAWHLAFLMTMGAAAALLTLAGREGAEASGHHGDPSPAA